MQVRELLPIIALLKTQRVRMYHSPDGALIGDFRREDILPAVCGKTVAALLDASLLCMDANNNYINLYVATGKDN